MSQHDYDIANGGGAAVRADINNALAAIQSLNSGATAPTSTVAGMLWYDTNTGSLKQRNSANTAWVAAAELIAGGGQLAGLRNRIINGSFDVWQRGVSSNTAGGTFTADRWRQGGSTTGTFVVERTQTTQDMTSLGYISKPYCLRWNQSVAASSAMFLEQRIEDSRTLAGKSVTLSFIARLNSGSFSGATVQIGQAFGTGGSAGVNLTAQSIAGLTTSFQRFTFNFTLPEVGTKTIGAGDYLYVAINLPTSGTWDFEITGVQLEAGSVATPFEHRPYGTELALCQRYYYPSEISLGSAISTTLSDHVFIFKSEMRTVPTMVQLSSGVNLRVLGSTTNIGITSALISSNTRSANVQITRSTGTWTAGNAVVVTEQSVFGFSAEL